MTMLDDERLASLLARAGAAFDVPGTGVDDILARAAGRVAGAGDADGSDGPDGTDGTDGPDGTGEATGTTRRGSPRRRATAGCTAWWSSPARHRMLAVAACVVVALAIAGTVGALVRSPSRPDASPRAWRARRAARRRRPPRRPRPSPTAGRGGVSPQAQHWGAGHVRGPTRPKARRRSPGHDADRPAPCPRVPSASPRRSSRPAPWGSRSGRGRLARTMTQLTALAGAYGGFVANSQTQSGAGTGGAPYGSVTLQVPVQSFSAVLRAGAGARQDVERSRRRPPTSPGQYVDLQSRITALQDSRQQYLTILAKATTVGDVLAVQEQLDGIQSQIEQLQGQLQVLSERDVVLDADGDRQRGHAAAAARHRCPSPGSCGPGTTASAGSWPAWRAWSVWPGPCSSRCCAWACCWSAGAPCGAATSGTGSERSATDRRGHREPGHRHHADAARRVGALADRHRSRRRAR